jgi:hypothetical protein
VCVCLLFCDLSSIIGCIGLVGIFLASRVTYTLAFVRLRCVECRAGTNIFGRFAGLGGGPVRIFCLLGSVLACVCVINRWGGWRGSTFFLVFPALFWRVGAIEMVGGAVFKFYFPQFVVNCLGGWIFAVGILCYTFCSICSGFFWFLIIQLGDC